MTQEQINELLKPRYIVENLWFNCEFNPGDILVKIPYSNAFSVQGFEDGMYAITDTDIDKFPYLVRKLHWHQERKIEDLPKYLKWDNGPYPEANTVEKVIEWEEGPFGLTAKVPSQVNPIRAGYFLPATEADYNAYLQTLTHNKGD